MRDAREGKLTKSSAADKEELEMYERLMASDTDKELVLPHTSTIVNITAEEPTIITAQTSPSLHGTTLH